ncbi:MAG TPA: ATP-binding cassette domain-containing protein, partial [Candidatus Krumholzibacteria bacterium]
MSFLSLERVEKTYADGTCAVRGIDLEVDEGEFIVLLGPSGCGKTTTLRA